MFMLKHLGGALLAAALFAPVLFVGPPAQAADPITIGFGMALTGGLAPNGKAALLAMQIWEQDINAKGGLLGRPVKLVYYDDQSNPATVPALYTKLLDVDKVDLVVSGYATNMVVPALPVVMQHHMTFLGLLALAANTEFNDPNYFSISPTGGPQPKQSFSKGFFEVAMAQTPKPTTIAFVGADAEFAHNALDGAKELAQAAGLKVIYDRTYPPTTTDYSPIVRGIQAANPDLVFVASYPPDTVGIIRAASEIGLKAKLAAHRPLCHARGAGIPGALPGEVGRRRRRPAGLLPAALRLRRHAGAATGGRGRRQPRSAETRRLHPRPHIQDRRRRHHLRSERRVDPVPRAGSAVPQRQGQRCGPVQGPENRGRAVSAGPEERHADLSVFRRQGALTKQEP
jgi:hypothetical protein